MDGLEGFKILSKYESIQVSSFWNGIFVISFCFMLLSFFALMYAIYLREKELRCVFSVIILLCLLLLLTSVKNSYYIDEYKVTPVEDKYFIDLNKYELISQEDEIFTIKELNR